MSELLVTSIYNQEGEGAPNFPKGATVTGVITATSFSGSGANLTGIDATALKDENGTVRVQANTTGAVISGNVSVGGTLTYEDVTNVDSVGVITARSGIVATGVVTATSFSGSGANLTGIDAAPTVQATASGAIAANKAVKVNSDGTVSVPTLIPPAFQTEGGAASSVGGDGQVTAFYHAETSTLVMGFIRGASPYAKAGTVSGGTITWGSEVQLSSGGWDVRHLADIVYDPTTEKYILCYSQANDSGGIRSVWFKVSGTTISDYNNANQQTIESDNGTWIRACTGGNGKIVVAYVRSNFTVAMKTGSIGSGTGGAITWPGSYTNVESNNGGNDLGLTHDPVSGKVIVLFHETSSMEVRYRVQTVTGSGSGITNGTDRVFLDLTSYSSQQAEIQYVPRSSGNGAGRFILVGYTDIGTAGLYYKVGSLSGDELTLSSQTLISSQIGTGNPANKMAYNANRKTTGIVYKNTTSNDLKFREITVTDDTTNSTIDSVTQVVNDSITDCAITYDSSTKQDIIFYTTSTNSSKYKIRSDASSTANNGNFIGFSKEAYNNGQTATINVVGNLSTQSGLTPGQQYYVQNDGTIGLTATNANIEAGKALTATSLLIKG